MGSCIELQHRYVWVNGGLWPVGSRCSSAGVELSIVVPCFNEQASVGAVAERLTQVVEALAISFELIFVNDGSADDTWREILSLSASDSRVRGINLSRNFGQDQAIMAGCSLTSGEMVFVIDADLQDPPELLSDMLCLLNRGAEVVYGKRRSRQGETAFKRATAFCFYRLLDFMSSIAIPTDTGNFRLMRRSVVDAALQLSESDPYFRGLMAWVGFRQVPLFYDRAPRISGRSKWPTGKMLALATNALLSFSRKPLTHVLTVTISLLALLALLSKGGGLVADAGWRNAVSYLCGIVMALILGAGLLWLYLVGEYLSRLSLAACRRPLYIVSEATPNRSNGKLHLHLNSKRHDYEPFK